MVILVWWDIRETVICSCGHSREKHFQMFNCMSHYVSNFASQGCSREVVSNSEGFRNPSNNLY